MPPASDRPTEPRPSTQRSVLIAVSSGLLSLLGGAGSLLVSAVCGVIALISAWFAYVCWVSEFGTDPFSGVLELVVIVLGLVAAVVSVTAGVVCAVGLAVAVISPALFLFSAWRSQRD